jgi:AraC-like DNA-binding protein
MVRLRRSLPAPRDAEVRFSVAMRGNTGVETRSDPLAYHWDGTHRGDPLHPAALFQYTLDGWGRFESPGVSRAMPANMMFAAVLPSAHRYFLPAESPSWSICWVIVHHPYLVDRIARRIATSGPTLSAPPNTPLAQLLAEHINRASDGAFADVFAWEAHLFAFVMEWERACERQARPLSELERLRSDVRDEVLRRMDQPVRIASLAGRYDMSRSAFAHHFKNTTGQSPAQFVTDLKLREVAQRLRESDEKLDRVARACGFADANHLCKVFKRHYATTPGQYRRQFRR